jgi:chloramphenicol 3-O-phosphotransferase
VIIWLNGAFGAGKTTTAKELVTIMPGARLFDPEMVGYLLMECLKDHDFSDFQELLPWRTLVPVVTSEIARFTGQHLIATQTVLNEGYWKELQQGFNQNSLEVLHVVLHVDSGVLAHRINSDELEQKARQWRLDHIRDYAAARAWMVASADLVVDSTSLSVAEVAGSILQVIQTSPT